MRGELACALRAGDDGDGGGLMRVTLMCEDCRWSESHTVAPMSKIEDALIDLICIVMNFKTLHTSHRVSVNSDAIPCWESEILHPEEACPKNTGEST